MVQNLNASKDGFQAMIHPSLSVIENFLELNRHAKNPCRIIPLSPLEHSFVSFSERELLVLLMS